LAAGFLFFPQFADGRPRGPLPPIPETGVLLHESFDFVPYSTTNSSFDVPGVGRFVESFSGFALSRDSQTVAPWIVPAVDPNSGHTNLDCDGSGAIRFYISPRWSSQSVPGGNGPGAAVHLADLVASSATGTAVVWSLQVTADGDSVQLLDCTGVAPVVVLSAPAAWKARQFHSLAMDFGPRGTALFIDGQLVAQGAARWPFQRL
jgi:hypothetical protein